ncbi:MAG: acyloxyacyl hydrolase [Flavobacteriia bacterium]|jgi:hypothetical protein
MKKLLLNFLLFFIFSTFTYGQKENIFFSAEYAYGAIIPEYQFVNSIVEKNIQQLEFSLLKKTYGTSYWQRKYNYPQFGFSLFASTLGNKTILGDEFALYPFVQFSSHPTHKFHIENKIGLGLGFATKRFDLEENYQNIAVGSIVNVHFNYRLGFAYDFNATTSLRAGLNFHHYSNANMKEPNLGINMVSASLGLTKAISPQKTRLTPEIPSFEKGNEFLFIQSFGGKHTRALQSDVYFTSSFAFEFNRKLNHIFHFGAGLDVFYDSSTKIEMSVKDSSNYTKKDDFRTGIHIAQEFVYNKCSFIIQEGIYLGLMDKVSHSFMYNKIIFRYKWNKHFITQAAVKSHLHILDYPEIGFSYYF